MQVLMDPNFQTAVTLLLTAWVLFMFVIIGTNSFVSAFFFKFVPLVLAIAQIAILIVGLAK